MLDSIINTISAKCVYVCAHAHTHVCTLMHVVYMYVCMYVQACSLVSLISLSYIESDTHQFF